MENQKYILEKWSTDNVMLYLFIFRNEKTETIHIPAKEWLVHGDLITNQGTGNGYHGNCSNCGMALVTDLGYTSWVKSPKCETKAKKEIKIIKSEKIGWTKFINRAGNFTKEKADKYFNQQRNAQGWGEYNFNVKEIT
jgi:hypothetical protein